jgi:hypothetical protein
MPEPATDPLSALAHDLIKRTPGAYERLTVTGPAPQSAHSLLDRVTPDQLLAVPIHSPVNASAMLAALWLWHDSLDECHRIVQKEPEDLDSAAPRASHRELAETLAFWHAIMHRREGDFSNSKYWYARCANHPVLKSMASHANEILHPLPADKSLLRIMRNGFDPNAFVDLVEQVHDQPSDIRHAPAISLQKIEWRALFDYCTRKAAGQ